jgi:histidinol-phosphatase (PHP family)
MSIDQLPEYVEAVASLKREFPDIAIKTGIEADYLPRLEKETERLLSAYDFDYVIGSVHFIDGWGFDDSRYIEGYKHKDLYELYARYFALVAGAAKTGLFDVIGHIDLIKKYNFKPGRDIAPLVENAVSAIKDAGAAVEINTAGLRKPVGEIYPSDGVLALCSAAGVPITFGSDAHNPVEVGMDFEAARLAAKRAGYDRLAVFTARTRNYIAL